jgi:hypothetical protein
VRVGYHVGSLAPLDGRVKGYVWRRIAVVVITPTPRPVEHLDADSSDGGRGNDALVPVLNMETAELCDKAEIVAGHGNLCPKETVGSVSCGRS